MDPLSQSVPPAAKEIATKSISEVHDVTKKTYFIGGAFILRNLGNGAACPSRRKGAGGFPDSGPDGALRTANRKHRSAAHGKQCTTSHWKHDRATHWLRNAGIESDQSEPGRHAAFYGSG